MISYPFAGKKLMTPGPVPLPESVKKSLATYECHHRSAEFTEVLQRTMTQLKKVFQTSQHCYLLAATGTGALEAAMVNTLSTQKPFLSINAGKFGERWAKIAGAYGIPCDELILPWGEDISLKRVEQQLSSGTYQALAFQACETSTGALLPVQELASLCQKHQVLSLVDAITALGAVDLPMDQWGLDVVVGGSQKAFMLPTGMSFLSLSEQAERCESELPCYYFDLKAEKKANLQGKTRYSTPTHFILALDEVLHDILEQKGFKNHLATIAQRAIVFRDATSLPLFPQTSSPSLSCLRLPEGVSGQKIKQQVSDEGFIIVSGQDQLADRVLRVGHMGDMSEDDLIQTARAIEKFL